ncbi:MAG: hypothetical protein WCS31_12545 [Verrucomicrobiae bacterium]
MKTPSGILCLVALLGLLATNVSAYEGTMFSPVAGAVSKIELVDASGKKSGCLWMNGPRLTAKWKEYSFAFTPEGNDGLVCIRVGPLGEGDIPYYYDEIKVNGVLIDNNSGWTFPRPLAGESKLVTDPALSFSGKPCLKLYPVPCAGASRDIVVTKGEKVVVSMMARSGSVLEAYAVQMSAVTASLDEAMKIGAGLKGDAMESGRELATSLNGLVALSGSQLHISVPPLTPDAVSLEALKAKTSELTKAYDEEKARTAGDELPCLYDQPKVRAEIKAKITEASRLAASLKTDCLLAFIFGTR